MEEKKEEIRIEEPKEQEKYEEPREKPIKKEIQGKIIEIQQNNNNGKATEEEFFAVLKMVSPGTNLRTALDGTLKAGKGALIVVENPEVIPLIDGGFRVNCRFTPQRLVELTKMDGAIIISKDIKRINHANVLLAPDNSIKSLETGTRHKAAERTAKQVGTLVIAISERKNEINLFYKNVKYNLKNTAVVLRKANEHIQLLEKQRELFDKHIDRLNHLELRNHPNLHQAMIVIQKGRMIQKISEDLRKYIIELGNEGSLLKTRLKELIVGVEKETNLVIKDYTNLDVKKSRILLDSLSYDEILDSENVMHVLAHETQSKTIPVKGWRMLSKTSLIESDVARIIKQSGSLGKAIYSNVREFTPILGEEKTAQFKQEIDRIKINSIN
jgi:diadenylate cyclase